MPLFTAYLNSVADAMVDDAGTLYLHTVAPTDADHTNGRTSAGGGAFENGLVTAAANWTTAANGDIENNVAFDFGSATAEVGIVIAWSYLLGTVPVAHGTLPSTHIRTGEPFSINANSLTLNGDST